jgi:hypothetical protein
MIVYLPFDGNSKYRSIVYNNECYQSTFRPICLFYKRFISKSVEVFMHKTSTKLWYWAIKDFPRCKGGIYVSTTPGAMHA